MSTPKAIEAMTLDEIRDELARMDGYTTETVENKTGFGFPYHTFWKKPDGTPFSTYNNNHQLHPHPATLDGAAAAMPEGWNTFTLWRDWPESPWCAKAQNDEHVYEIGRGPTELHARYALALAVRRQLAEVKP